MSLDNQSPRSGPLEIAVIGTGIAGMSAAWLLSKANHVTVYERDNRLGGHSNTVEVQDQAGIRRFRHSLADCAKTKPPAAEVLAHAARS
ncbi:MAG: FAD-dependent oxidoreductase [Rhodospirillales bacterium]